MYAKSTARANSSPGTRGRLVVAKLATRRVNCGARRAETTNLGGNPEAVPSLVREAP
jgi:hypothetical protein